MTYIPSFGDPGLWPLLEKSGIDVKTRPRSHVGWGNIPSLLFFLGLLVFGFVMLRRMRMQRPDIFSASNLSQLREYTRRAKRLSFSDVAGLLIEREEIPGSGVLQVLKDPDYASDDRSSAAIH